jgi:hypothetical protein
MNCGYVLVFRCRRQFSLGLCAFLIIGKILAPHRTTPDNHGSSAMSSFTAALKKALRQSKGDTD